MTTITIAIASLALLASFSLSLFLSFRHRGVSVGFRFGNITVVGPSVIAVVGTLLGVGVTLVAVFSTQTEPDPGITPAAATPRFRSVRIVDTVDLERSWLISVYAPERTAFSQGTAVLGSTSSNVDEVCPPGGTCFDLSDLPDDETYRIVERRIALREDNSYTYCVELLASSFEVIEAAVPPCGNGLENGSQEKWAWSLLPKDSVSGTQQLVFTISVVEGETPSH